MSRPPRSPLRTAAEPLKNGGALPRPHLVAILLGLLLFICGCSSTQLNSTYGQRRGTRGGPSVNGTAVLAGMFERAGHRVTSWRRLSPKLEQCQTIVWCPDDFAPPTTEQREFLEWWLQNDTGRTLVYVGRDYDATETYWKQVLPSAPPHQTWEVWRRLAMAQSSHFAARARMPADQFADWFTFERDEPRRKVQELAGPWSVNIDASQIAIELAGTVSIPSADHLETWTNRDDYYWEGNPDFTPLLKSTDDVLAYQLTLDDWGDSKIIVVNNGSFLLNFPLVHPEHRKIAGHLINACGPGRVVFLESGLGGPTVYDTEPNAAMPTGFEALTVWPLGFIIMHIAVLGLLACIALYPIFGRPRAHPVTEAPADSDTVLAQDNGAATVIRTDFSKHLTALGELLESTEDREYARSRVAHYHEHVRRETKVRSGKTRRRTAP